MYEYCQIQSKRNWSIQIKRPVRPLHLEKNNPNNVHENNIAFAKEIYHKNAYVRSPKSVSSQHPTMRGPIPVLRGPGVLWCLNTYPIFEHFFAKLTLPFASPKDRARHRMGGLRVCWGEGRDVKMPWVFLSGEKGNWRACRDMAMSICGGNGRGTNH